MIMATAASLYSSSPTTIPSGHGVPCSSLSTEIEFLPRSSPPSHHPAPRFGIASLLSTSGVRHSASDAAIDAGPPSRRSSYTDLCALLDNREQRLDLSTSPKNKVRSSMARSPSLCNVPTSPISNNVSSSPKNIEIAEEQLTFHIAEWTVTEFDAFKAKQGNSGFRKLKCSSLSEFFCKPLSPETFRSPQDVLHNAQRQYEIFKDPLIVKAFKAAEHAHRGQFRADGDPYLVHCVETAMLLASIKANKMVVAAGLLHDIIDDSAVNFVELEELFGVEIAKYVEGVTKVSEFSKLARDSGTAYNSVEADRLHTMILAMTDVRIDLIKLADRLHNMRTIGALPEEKRQRIAKETLEVFVPLASRLGILTWKAEMEDLCFKHLQPCEYQELARKLLQGFREVTIMSAIQKLDASLLANGVQCSDLCGRRKNLYSIYRKMMRKGKKISEIYDLQGLRLTVSSVGDCYAALDIIHQMWPCIPGKLKDYIVHPKANGYQSLHTVVLGEDGLPLEIQIRTKEMHYQAEFGVAAHWRYKEDDKLHSSFVLQMVEWARWVLTWQDEIIDMKLRLRCMECTFPIHKDTCTLSAPSMRPPFCKDSPLFVIVLEDGEMAVSELPGGSTLADLLQRRDEGDDMVATSGVSFWEESKLQVNHKHVQDIHQRLQMGDLIELAKPSIKEKSLSECREKLKRMYEHDTRGNQASSLQRLSQVVVY